jgi:uncharacterized membrane protein
MKTKRWLSRKFIVSLAAQGAAIAALIWPGHEDAIYSAAQSIVALVVLALSALGYVRIEGGLDRQALEKQLSPPDGS